MHNITQNKRNLKIARILLNGVRKLTNDYFFKIIPFMYTGRDQKEASEKTASSFVPRVKK